jgi:ferric-dicitrate binding protein FerR (iron transport regulator)
MSDPLFDGTGDAARDGDATRDDDAAELAKLEAKLAVFAHDAPLRELPTRRAPVRRRWPMASLGATVAAAAALFVWLGSRRDIPNGPCARAHGFAFSLAAGSMTCGGHRAVAGELPIGQWLETTGDDARASLTIANIGQIAIHGAAKLRIAQMGPTQQRLELASGAISAKVTAPPRLFIVDTPSSSAVDLGCEYELSTDHSVGTTLKVTRGAVSLESKRGALYVPATFSVTGDGLPVYEHATMKVRLSAAAVGNEDLLRPSGDPMRLPVRPNVQALTDAAGPDDRVTLWNAINRTDGNDRAALVAKLEELAPLPDPALHAKVLAGDADAMDIWLDVFVDRGNLAHDKRRAP